MMLLNEYLDPTSVLILLICVSLAVGSFLNVVIYRLPLMMTDCSEKKMNLAWPPSFCPHCQAHIRWFDNIPLLSYFILKGRCRTCQQKINPSYVCIEALTLILSLFVFYHFGINWMMLVSLLFTWWLIALAVIDIKHLLLPDELTQSLLWFGLLINYFHLVTSLQNAVLGAALGYISFGLINKIYFIFRKQDGIGQGDWKLFAALGAFFGWQSLLGILTFAAFLGVIFGSIIIFYRRVNKNTPLPFGFFLALAGWLYLFFPYSIKMI